MDSNADRLAFAPPPQPAAVRAFVLAILAHLLLMLALTWGLNWKRESEDVAAEAELWSGMPQQAAPRVVQAPPLPPLPVLKAPPVAQAEPPPAPAARAPDIALEREAKRREQAERMREELERKKRLDARKKQQELEREKKLDARKKQEELKRQELALEKATEEKKNRKAQESAKARSRQEEAKLAALRKENMERMMKGAAGTGPASSTGSASRPTGPSASYAGRIAARIKPNIVFADVVSGNPAALVEIRVAPDGTIVGRKLLESSGVKSWDEAVLRAIDRTEVLPRDIDGRVVPQFPIRFRPHD